MIKENTNRAIFYNSLILMIKLLVNTLTTIFATRFTLKAMGAEDFGLFAVLGGIVALMAILNTIMVATSNRFISVAIGKGDVSDINSTFNVNFLIHVTIAVITLLVAIPIGHVYVYNYLNYNGHLDTAAIVMYTSIVGSAISFISVPFNGLLMSKENFLAISLVDIVSSVFKLVLAYTILFVQKECVMIVYTMGIFVLTVVPTIFYYIYSKAKYTEITKFRLVKDKDRYKACLGFSVWVSYGAIASVLKTQGAAVIINSFFTTIMNAALSIANTVNSFILLISQSVSQPITPQITKSYAKNDTARCDELLVLSTKLTFVVSFLISLPILKETEWFLNLWLGSIPDHGILFTRLLIIDTLITSLNSGISTIIFASGRIKLYQLLINTLRLLSVVLAYLAIRLGGPAESLLYAYIIISILIVMSSQIVLKKTLDYKTRILWKYSYFPSIVLVIISLPVLCVNIPLHPLYSALLVVCWGILAAFIVILSKNERERVYYFIKKILETAKSQF